MPGAENLHQILNQTAAGYVDLGWSVVPLWGDSKPEQAKVAAIAWGPYQRRRASLSEVDRWFNGTSYAGIGIVTGSISQLAVLDFDDETIAQAFERELPDLASTRMILTRRGRHLYFQVPPQLRVASRKLAGVDLLSDGHYVVAPPTVINGHEYTVGRGGRPKTLDQNDIDRITRFLVHHTRAQSVVCATGPQAPAGRPVALDTHPPQAGAFSCQDESIPTMPRPVEPADESFLTAEALVGFYRALARQAKRNVALFKTSCLARDHGWKFEAVVAVLAGVHADERPVGQHRCENRKARQREAIRTIRSAFSKPPRPPRPKDSGGLFNSIRERLMQLGQTCVVRVLEGLRLAGFKAGQLVSERTVLEALKGLVGRHSIRLALAAKTLSGEALFERVSPSLHSPHSSAATQVRIDRQPNAYVNGKKPDSIRGRQAYTYRIPSAEALCQRLGVAPSGSDPVTLEDLQTAKKTRQALHRELIRRRPGLYLRKWLGDRLGVTERTVSSYNGQTQGVNVTPTFTQTPLSWGNLNAIPAPEVAPAGTCLEDATGKRWPALKGIAQKLLAQGRGVKLLVRSLNYYWCGQGDPPVSAGLRVERTAAFAPDLEQQEPVVTFAQHIERLVRDVGAPPTSQPPARPSTVPTARKPDPISTPSTRDHYTKLKLKRRYWKPFEDSALETLALQAYRLVNNLTANPADKASLVSARRWVDLYGETAVRTALTLLTSRRNIHKPAAFVATTLRTLRLT